MYFRLIAIISTFFIFGGMFFYYKMTQKQILELNEQIQMSNIIVQEQKQTIYGIQNSISKQNQIREELEIKINKSERNIEKIQNTIAKHNLALIASKKSSLLEKKINRASLDIMRCFEIATGSPVLKDEKNNQCPEFITNH